MEKILITGLNGFVAKHFLDYLEDNHIRAQVLGIDIQPACMYNGFKYIDFHYACIDLLQQKEIEKIYFSFSRNMFCIWHRIVVWLSVGKIRY